MNCSNCPKEIIPNIDVAHLGLCDACRSNLNLTKKQRKRLENE